LWMTTRPRKQASISTRGLLSAIHLRGEIPVSINRTILAQVITTTKIAKSVAMAFEVKTAAFVRRSHRVGILRNKDTIERTRKSRKNTEGSHKTTAGCNSSRILIPSRNILCSKRVQAHVHNSSALNRLNCCLAFVLEAELCPMTANKS